MQDTPQPQDFSQGYEQSYHPPEPPPATYAMVGSLPDVHARKCIPVSLLIVQGKGGLKP